MKIRWNKKILVAVPILAIILTIIIFMNNGYREYLTLGNEMEIYKLAEEKLTNGWDEAKDVCSRLKNDKKISGCYYNLIIPFLENINQQAFMYNLDQLEKICKDMPDNSWKGECYFTLADYLIHANIKQAARLCNLSQKAYGWPCYNHVAYKIGSNVISDVDSKKRYKFCELAEELYKSECYMGFWGGVGSRFYHDLSAGISACSKAPVEFRNSCFEALGRSAGSSFSQDISAGISACSKAPVEFRNYCFEGLGRSTDFLFRYDISTGISACNQVPLEFRNYCYKGLNGSEFELII